MSGDVAQFEGSRWKGGGVGVECVWNSGLVVPRWFTEASYVNGVLVYIPQSCWADSRRRVLVVMLIPANTPNLPVQ